MDLESELFKIRSENQKLKSEVTQALADKEFVWSLWKRLQVSSPDVTQAISLVIQREKEKSEAKDKKVLQILHLKDTKLEELQSIIAKQSKELSEVIRQKTDLLDTNKRLEADVINLSDHKNSLEKKVWSHDSRQEDAHRRTVEAYEMSKLELTERVTHLQTELTRVKTESGDLLARKVMMDNRIRMLEEELEAGRSATLHTLEARQDLEKLQEENRAAASRWRENEEELRGQLEEMKEKCLAQNRLLKDMKRDPQKKEMVSLKSELIECQAKLAHYQTPQDSRDSTTPRRTVIHSNRRQGANNSNVLFDLEGGRKRNVVRFDSLSDELETVSDSELTSCSDMAYTGPVKRTSRRRRNSMGDVERSDGVMSPVVDLNYKVGRLENQLLLLSECLQNKNGSQNSSHHQRSQSANAASPLQHRYRPTPQISGQTRKASFAMEALKKKVALLSEKLSRSEHSLTLKTCEYSKTKESLERTTDRLKAAQSNCRNLTEELSEVKNECLQWRLELEVKDKDYETKVAQLQDQHNTNMELKDALNTLKEQHHFDTSRIQEYVATLDQMRQRFEHRLSENPIFPVNRVKDENFRQLDQELQKTLAKNDQLEAEVHSLRKEITSFSTFQAAWQSERNGLKHELQIAGEQLGQKRVEISALKRSLQNAGITCPMSLDTSHSSPVPMTTAAPTVLRSTLRPPSPLANQSNHFSVHHDDQWEDVEDEEPCVDSATLTNDNSARSCDKSIPRDSDRTLSSLGEQIQRVAEANHVGQERSRLREQEGIRGGVHGRSATSGGVQSRGLTSRRRPRWRQKEAERQHTTRLSSQTRATTSGPVKKSSHDDLDMIPTRDTDSHVTDEIDGDVSLAATLMRVSPNQILKRRVASLQQQLRALRKLRSQSASTITSLQTSNSKMRKELDQANARTRRLKDTVELLHGELSALHENPSRPATSPTRLLANHPPANEESDDDIVSQLDDDDVSVDFLSVPANHNVARKKTSVGFVGMAGKGLEAKLRDQGTELIRQAALIRNLRTEVEVKEEKLKELRERLARADRDSMAKRQLLDEMRQRVNANSAVTQIDKEAIVDNEDRLVGYKELLDRQRVQLDSAKTRLQTAMEERKRYETELRGVQEECDKRGRQVTEGRTKRAELERQVAELERVGRERVAQIVSRSEAAVDSAGKRLSTAQLRLIQFERLLPDLINFLSRTLDAVRDMTSSGNRRNGLVDDVIGTKLGDVSSRSMAKAIGRAADLLNFSPSDLDDFLHPAKMGHVTRPQSSLSGGEVDQDWTQRCKKLIFKEEFLKEISPVLETKFDEIVTLVKSS